jgi:hypothetical protein
MNAKQYITHWVKYLERLDKHPVSGSLQLYYDLGLLETQKDKNGKKL